jgi:hypothetical protein
MCKQFYHVTDINSAEVWINNFIAVGWAEGNNSMEQRPS